MNLFSVSSLILCFSSIIFGLIVYRSDRKNKINRAWFFSSISFSLWSLGLAGVTLSSNIETALLWQYLLDIAAIFLPPLSLLLILELLHLRGMKTRYFSFIAALLLSIFSFSHLFKDGMKMLYDFYWVNPGNYYIIFPIYFVIFAVMTLGLLVQQYIKAPRGSLVRFQVRNILIASTFAYFGGVTNFFPQLFSVYPFGNYLVIFYIVFMVYGVLKYKMLNVKVVSAQIFSTALVLISLFNLLKSSELIDWLLNFLILVLMAIFSLFLIRSVIKEVNQREHIEKLAKDLTDANTRLKELDKQKSEFVSFATHQLRAPLTAMKGYSSLILEGEMGKLVPTMKEAVTRIYDSSKTLANIVDDYLNISRIELGTMVYSFTVLDLRAMVKDVIAELKPNIEKTGLKFSFMTVPSGENEHFDVKADRDKLKQVIANLIDNSLKYTPSGSIEVALTKNAELHKIIFSVKDTGVGVSPEVMPKLFAKFVRANNANKQNIYGTGLGLFVVKEIVTSHKGRVWAESKGEGKGSTFFMEIDTAI